MLLYTKKKFINKKIFFLVFLLFFLSSIIMYSATYQSSENFSPYFIKQVFGFISGILLTFFLSHISYKKMIIWGFLIHISVLFLLIFTLFKGHYAMGGTRWIDLGLFRFQPSELAKITLPLSIVHYLFYYCHQKITLENWFFMLINIFLTAFFVIKQPDLGSGILIILSGLSFLFIIGLPRKIIFTGVIFFIIAFPLFWGQLHEYQKKRILVFLGQGSVHKERYQLEQSKIAVGSGGFYGKGVLQGTQKNLHFLPENRTDFIFAVVAEEFGFLGVTIIFLLYVSLFIFLFFQGKRIDDQYGYLLYQAMIFPFVISIICNIGMVIGLLPVVGIPLPMMSYGITHVWSSAIMFGIGQSIFNKTEE